MRDKYAWIRQKEELMKATEIFTSSKRPIRKLRLIKEAARFVRRSLKNLGWIYLGMDQTLLFFQGGDGTLIEKCLVQCVLSKIAHIKDLIDFLSSTVMVVLILITVMVLLSCCNGEW